MKSGQDLLGLQVPLAVGTLQWGTTPVDQYMINSKGCITENEAAQIVQDFSEAGVTLWDTAEGYGGGTSEARLGRLFSSSTTPTTTKTKTPILMTKFLPTPWRGFFPGDMERAIRASCKRLQTSKIDIYLLHSPVHWRSLEYWIERGAECKHKGLIGAMGLSNCNANQVRCAVAAGKHYGVDVVFNQVHYSLLDYNSDNLQEMQRVCQELNVAIVGFSAIGQGLLTDGLTPETFPSIRPAKMLRLKYDDLTPLRTKLLSLSQVYGKSMAQIAINWCMCHGVVPLVGCRSQKQAKDSIGALGWNLKEEDVLELDKVALAKSTLDSPKWRRMIFVTLFGIVKAVCQLCDTLGYGMVQQAKRLEE